MSIEAMNWAFKLKLKTPTQKIVLLALADAADTTTASCWTAIQTIANQASVNEKTVRRTLSVLEALGLISRERRYKGWNQRTSDQYDLHLNVLDLDYSLLDEVNDPGAETPVADKLSATAKPVDNYPVEDNMSADDWASKSADDWASMSGIDKSLTQMINHHLPESENLVKKLSSEQLKQLSKVLPRDDDQEIFINSDTVDFLKQVNISEQSFLELLPKYEIDPRQTAYKEFHNAVKPAFERILKKRASIGYMPVYLGKAIKVQLSLTPMKSIEKLVGAQFFNCAQNVHKVMSLDGYCVICSQKSDANESDILYFQLSNRYQNKAVRS